MTRPALIDVAGLTVVSHDGQTVLNAVNLQVAAGEPVTVTGPSGAGKTTLALALLGHVRPGLSVVSGTVRVAGRLLLPAGPADLRALRREVIHYVPQDPLAALTPTMRAGELLDEALGARSPRRPVAPPAAGLLRLVGLPDDREFLRRHPHQMSGGQRQRLTLAMALAGRPAVIVLDEPTAGQDPASRDEILGELRRVGDRAGATFITITHDRVTARALGRTVLRLEGGRLFPGAGLGPDPAPGAQQPAGGQAPPGRAPATAGCARGPGSVRPADHRPAVLEATGLRAGHAGRDVLHEVDLAVRPGECLGVIGATGSGKTTLVRALTGLHPASGGTVAVHGTVADPRAIRRPRAVRRSIGVVFQDPFTSLNPGRRVGRILADVTGLPRAQAARTAGRLLLEVGLDPALARRYPRELSGGQQQRVAIARALAQRPDLLIGDEITAALDQASRDGICDLLAAIRAQRGLALLIVSHDHAVIERLADTVLVLGNGRVLASGPPEKVIGGRPARLGAPEPGLGGVEEKL